MLKCAAMNALWLGAMSYLALQDHPAPDLRTYSGIASAWLLATAATWLLFRRAPALRLWQLAVWTFLASIVALVFVTVSAYFVTPPPD